MASVFYLIVLSKEIKITSIHRDWNSLNKTKSMQLLLSWTISFVLFGRSLHVIFLQKGMAEQQREDCCVLAGAPWAGGTHTKRLIAP